MANAAAAAPASGQLSAKKVKSFLMRTTGPQQYYIQPWTSLQTFQIPKNVPLNQPLAYMHMQFKGRFTVTANFTDTPAEAPQNLIQQFQLRGTHNVLGNLTPYQVSGADLFTLARIFGIRGNSLFINGVLQPELSSPMGIGAAHFSTTGGAGGTGVYDIEINYVIPMMPYNLPDEQNVQYLFSSAAWGQTLQVQIVTGDATCFGTTGVGTFSAFGSSSGSPSINLLTTYASLGPLQNSIAQAVSVKNVSQIGSILTSVANNVRLQLLQNQRTLNVIVKTGIAQTGASAGVSNFQSLSDAILEQVYLNVNNNPIRNLQLNSISKEFYGMRANTHQPQGYLNISFVDGYPAGNVYAGLKGENLPGSAQFNCNGNVISSPGNVTGEVIQDMIYGEPVVAGQS